MSNIHTFLLGSALVGLNTIPAPPSTFSIFGLLIAGLWFYKFVKSYTVVAIVAAMFGVLLLPIVATFLKAEWINICEMAMPFFIFWGASVIVELGFFQDLLIRVKHEARKA